VIKYKGNLVVSLIFIEKYFNNYFCAATSVVGIWIIYFFMTRIIILAAGKGTRMNSELPKALVLLKGRPMIKYLLDSIRSAGIDQRPLIVVSPDNKEIISRELKEYEVDYAIQDCPLGTGHAVSCAENFLASETKKVLVLYGDHPFFKAESIKKFAALDQETLAMMTVKLSDFSDWRHNFYHWGRIIRDENGRIIKITEFKDANETEKEISEVNPAVMGFNKEWLFENLKKINNDNKSEEYYLTDLVKIAFDQGAEIGSVSVEPQEAMGVNSREELEIAEGLLK
jgi:bifunctional UDP-N-acetylglucosamine pyrophosphorylase/glucosamine-1-phosphate N-acetyltransferase